MDFVEKVKALSLINNEEIKRMFMDRELSKSGFDKFFIIQSEVDKLIKDFNSVGINTTEKREDEIIISMTCMPGRFNMLKYALYSLMTQTKKPDKIILTLSTDEIPDQIISDYILEFEKLGLTFHWIKENLKRDKKLFPLFETIDDNAMILFGDDDIYYKPNWLETLYDAYDHYRTPCYYLFGRYEDLRTKKIMVLHPRYYEKTHNACNRSPVSIPFSGLGLIMQLKYFIPETRNVNFRNTLECFNDDEFYLWSCAKRSKVPLQKIRYNLETKWVDPFFIMLERSKSLEKFGR